AGQQGVDELFRHVVLRERVGRRRKVQLQTRRGARRSVGRAALGAGLWAAGGLGGDGGGKAEGEEQGGEQAARRHEAASFGVCRVCRRYAASLTMRRGMTMKK